MMDDRRYNGKYDALRIIDETLPPQSAAKFHHGSRKPYDYEQPVLDVAKAAMAEVGGFRNVTQEKIMKATYINLPYWPFDVEEGLMRRIQEVNSWFGRWLPSKPLFRVALTNDQWPDLTTKNEARAMFTFFVRNDDEVHPTLPPDGGEYEQWIQIANVLFFVEK
jgi:hypothetical protein